MQNNEASRQFSSAIRIGSVAELDIAKALCRVETGGVTTDFLPWLAPRAGDTTEWSAPTEGEQVIVLSPEGDTRSAVVLRGVYSNAFPAPASAANEHVTRYADGAVIKYDHSAHALTAQLPSGGTATITADGGVTINGPLTVNGDTKIVGDTSVSKTLTAATDVVGGGKSLKGHKHTGVQGGSAVSGPPQ